MQFEGACGITRCYSRRCSAADIGPAFADGRIRSEDILLTDGVPAQTPLVAGIISLAASNHHYDKCHGHKTAALPAERFSDAARSSVSDPGSVH